MFNFSGKRPNNLGITEGKLAPCPGTPNCVNTQRESESEIKPLPPVAIPELKKVIESMARTKVIDQTSNYLYAEFKSQLMGFVDDVEFYLDPDANVLHVRSASRLGQSDLGVNRKRVEDLRAKLSSLA